jgi:hypothetical protein
MSQCHYCSRDAEFLCDFVLEARSIVERLPQTTDEFVQAMLAPERVEMKTCDRPLCAEHRHQIGTVFFDGTDSAGRRKGWTDSRDLCPGHAQGPDHRPPYVPIGGGRCA